MLNRMEEMSLSHGMSIIETLLNHIWMLNVSYGYWICTCWNVYISMNSFAFTFRMFSFKKKKKKKKKKKEKNPKS